MTPANSIELSVDMNPREKDIEDRYANLIGHKKPFYARTAEDQKALDAAQEKRRRKAQKRLNGAQSNGR